MFWLCYYNICFIFFVLETSFCYHKFLIIKFSSAVPPESHTLTTQPQAQKEPDAEDPLDEDIEEALGKDPSETDALKIQIHSKLIARWKYYLTKGLPTQSREKLLSKYEEPKDWTPPKLNSEVKKMTSHNNKNLITKDEKYMEVQKLATLALTSLGSAVDMLKYLYIYKLKQSLFIIFIHTYIFSLKYLVDHQKKAWISRSFSKDWWMLLIL